jgi:hypothetical protein
MPNPQIGAGAAVSKGLHRYQYALYLAPAGSGASYPVAPLVATEPTGGWVRQGRLKDDTITWNVPKPQFLEGRAGFNKSLQFYVPRQAEMVEVTAELDETDPLVMANLRGQAGYNSLASGAYLGEEFIYKTGQRYAAKMLLVGLDVQAPGPNGNVREDHVFSGSCVVTFAIKDNDAYAGLEFSAVMLDVSSTETFRRRQWEAN